jgi:hypothetical protein
MGSRLLSLTGAASQAGSASLVGSGIQACRLNSGLRVSVLVSVTVVAAMVVVMVSRASVLVAVQLMTVSVEVWMAVAVCRWMIVSSGPRES